MSVTTMDPAHPQLQTREALPCEFCPGSTAAESGGDWRAEADRIVATAPADSLLRIVVFVAWQSRQAFTDWTDGKDVAVTYVFHGFSGYSISLEVGALPALKEAPGITGVDWGAGIGWPAC